MKTSELVERYLACRRATGIKYKSGTTHLRRLVRFVRDTGGLTKRKVGKAILSDGRLTLTSRMRRSTFAVFFRWCVARGYLQEMPVLPELPRDLPRRRPHIFTDDEIRRLLSVRHEFRDRSCCIPSECARTIFLLTYALGLRISEAMSLKLKDIDAAANVATIRETKFYKTRIVPYNRIVARKLDEFMRWRRKAGMPLAPESPLFAQRTGLPSGTSRCATPFAPFAKKPGSRMTAAARTSTTSGIRSRSGDSSPGTGRDATCRRCCRSSRCTWGIRASRGRRCTCR